MIDYVILLTYKRGSVLIIWRKPRMWMSFDQAELSNRIEVEVIHAPILTREKMSQQYLGSIV